MRFSVGHPLRRAVFFLLILAGAGMGLGGCSKPDRIHKAAGNLYLRRGDVTRALAEFRQAIALAPNDADSHTLLGDALFEKGALNDAKAAYQKALGLDPKAVEAHRGLGTIAVSQKDFSTAKTHFQSLVRATSSDYRAWRSLGLIAYQEKNYDQAIDSFVAGLRSATGDPASLYHLSLSLIYKGDEVSLGRAERVIAELGRATPDKPFAPYAQALLLSKRGDGNGPAVVEALRRALDAGLPKSAVDSNLKRNPRVAALLEEITGARAPAPKSSLLAGNGP